MDDQTRHVHYESIRSRNHGNQSQSRAQHSSQGLKKSNYKELFLVHKSLEKQCTVKVRHHATNIKLMNSKLEWERMQMLKKQSRLQKVGYDH